MSEKDKQPQQNQKTPDEIVQAYQEQQGKMSPDGADRIIQDYQNEIGKLSTSGLAEQAVQDMYERERQNQPHESNENNDNR